MGEECEHPNKHDNAHNQGRLGVFGPVGFRKVRRESAEIRHLTADSRQHAAKSRKQTTDSRQQTADSRQQTADSRQQTADSRQQTADNRQHTADSRQQQYPSDGTPSHAGSSVATAGKVKSVAMISSRRVFALEAIPYPNLPQSAL
jgi:hypothetical protein